MIVNSGYDLVNYHEIKSEWSYFLSFPCQGSIWPEKIMKDAKSMVISLPTAGI